MYILPNGQLAGVCSHPGNYGAIAGYDDGFGCAWGYGGSQDEPYGLSGIFGSIKKAASKVGKAVGTVAKGAVKVAGKGVQVAAKVAPVAVALIPGVGIPAAIGITAAAKGASALTRGKNIKEVAKETIIGGAEGAAAGAINKYAFGGRGYKSVGDRLGLGGKKVKSLPGGVDIMEREQQARDDLAQAGRKRGYGKKLPMPGGTSIVAPAISEAEQALRDKYGRSYGTDVMKRGEKKGIGGLLGKLLKAGKDTAKDAAEEMIASTGSPSGGTPAAGGGGGFSYGGGGSGGSSPGVTEDAAPVQEAGLLSGGAMPLLLIGGLVLAASSKR